jgi:myo-inositol-1(or 4)-monophosphatase
MRPPAPSWIFPASPVRSRWSNGSAGGRRNFLHPRIGSLALRLCRVAHGRLDAAFAGGQSRDWDLAAANLIVQEANGNMTALSGDSILYNRREVTHGVLVAAGRDRHASIVEHFRTSRPLP